MNQEESSVRARVFLFSGRPDPEFPLDDEAVSELRSRLKGAIGVEMANPPPAGGLGYRGFLVINSGHVAGLPLEFRAYRNVISELEGKRARHWVDLGKVEDWLLEQARRHGLRDALEVFLTGMQPSS